MQALTNSHIPVCLTNRIFCKIKIILLLDYVLSVENQMCSLFHFELVPTSFIVNVDLFINYLDLATWLYCRLAELIEVDFFVIT